MAAFGREGGVRWINDPEIGDRIAVALDRRARHAASSVRRATMEAALLPAAHGAVVEPRADDLTVAFADGRLSITRGEGLISAPPASATEAQLNAAMLEAALTPGDDAPIAVGEAPAEIRRRIDDLTRRAADEGVREGRARHGAHGARALSAAKRIRAPKRWARCAWSR